MEKERWKLTDTCNNDEMAVLSFSHNGKYGFDDIHVGEEVDFKDLIY